jgi:HK97 family phage major capsid protein
MKREELIASLEAKQAELKGVLAKDALTAEEAQAAKALDTEIEAIEAQIKEVDAVDALRQKAAARDTMLKTVANPLPQPEPNAVLSKAGDAGIQAVYAVPTAAKVKNFTGKGNRTAEDCAYRFGTWLFGGLFGSAKHVERCRQMGIEIKTMVEGLNERGGVFVPAEFEMQLIDLREKYGLFRQWAFVSPMSRDTKEVPRRTGGVTAYPIGPEGTAITASDASYDMVSLVAKKWGALTKITSELSEDSMIDVADLIAGEIAYAFAEKEDDCGFNGDATSTYHGITGLCPKIKGLSATIADIAGLFVGAGNAYTELLLTDFQGVLGKLPVYARTPNTAWYVSAPFYEQVMQKFKMAAGGVTAAEVVGGAREERFLGFPVRLSQKLPQTEANSQVCALLGDLRLGVTFGDRRETTLALSEHSDFASDLIAIRGTERFDINCHDVGNASATAASRVPGPVVGLITAAS